MLLQTGQEQSFGSGGAEVLGSDSVEPFLDKPHKAQPADLRCFWVCVTLKQSPEKHVL